MIHRLFFMQINGVQCRVRTRKKEENISGRNATIGGAEF